MNNLKENHDINNRACPTSLQIEITTIYTVFFTFIDLNVVEF